MNFLGFLSSSIKNVIKVIFRGTNSTTSVAKRKLSKQVTEYKKLTPEETKALKKRIRSRIAQGRQRMQYKQYKESKPKTIKTERIKLEKKLGREKKFAKKVLNKKEMLVKRERMVKVFWDRIKNILGSGEIDTGDKQVDKMINDWIESGDYQQLHNLYMFIGKYDLIQWDKILSPDSYKDQALQEASAEENKQSLIDAVKAYADTYNIDLGKYTTLEEVLEDNKGDTSIESLDLMGSIKIPDQQDLVDMWDKGIQL